jgi:2-iminobutanoate/2-iminopropanoate deaminase
VEAAGFSMSDVVAVNVYLARISDFAEMNKVYTIFIPDPEPTRTTIQAARLVNDGRIEVCAVAVKH